MKKHNIKILALTTVLCASAAVSSYASNAELSKESDKSAIINSAALELTDNTGDFTSSSCVSLAEAYESNEEFSSDEQAKAEKIRRDEIAEQYSIYEPYGMTYDREKDRFSYNGKIVRYFKDKVSEENTNSFFFDDGVIDVEPVRDNGGKLTGLKQSADEDFKARTKKQEEMKAEFEADGITGESGCFEGGDQNYRDDSLDAYIDFGVTYDKESDNWMYNEKAVHFLYDADYNIYCDNGINGGISLSVIRDKNGNIEKLVETETQELEQYIK